MSSQLSTFSALPSAPLSSAERDYIAGGIACNCRSDGRQRMDYRYFNLKTAVLASANGSARLKLEGTDMLCAVTMEIADVEYNTPNLGKLSCAVECSASASPDFEGYGAKEMNIQLSSELERMLVDSRSFDLSQLCIIPGKQCWHVYVDVLVLSNGGNLLDAMCITVKAALSSTVVPNIDIVIGDSGQQEIAISDDPFNTKNLDVASVPICVSLNRVGSEWLIDSSVQEETVMNERLSFAINSRGDIVSTRKHGFGALSTAVLSQLMNTAIAIGKDLNTKIVSVIAHSGKKI